MTLADELRNLAENWADADNVTTSLRLADTMANKLIWLADNLDGAGLTDERAELEKDAARYRWLRDPATFQPEPIRHWLWNRPFSNMTCLDEAIDNAIGREKGEK